VTELPVTRFTRVDDLDYAYQVVGPAAELDLVFIPGRGLHQLKGVPDEWQLYAVEHT